MRGLFRSAVQESLVADSLVTIPRAKGAHLCSLAVSSLPVHSVSVALSQHLVHFCATSLTLSTIALDCQYKTYRVYVKVSFVESETEEGVVVWFISDCETSGKGMTLELYFSDF